MTTKLQRQAQRRARLAEALTELQERAKFAALPMSVLMEKLRKRLAEERARKL